MIQYNVEVHFERIAIDINGPSPNGQSKLLHHGCGQIFHKMGERLCQPELRGT